MDIYKSALAPDGRLGIVFEQDDETAYLYLWDSAKPDGGKILSASSVKSMIGQPAEHAVRVAWSTTGLVGGLFAEGRLIAVIEVTPDFHSNPPKARPATEPDSLLFLQG